MRIVQTVSAEYIVTAYPMRLVVEYHEVVVANVNSRQVFTSVLCMFSYTTKQFLLSQMHAFPLQRENKGQGECAKVIE